MAPGPRRHASVVGGVKCRGLFFLFFVACVLQGNRAKEERTQNRLILLFSKRNCFVFFLFGLLVCLPRPTQVLERHGGSAACAHASETVSEAEQMRDFLVCLSVVVTVQRYCVEPERPTENSLLAPLSFSFSFPRFLVSTSFPPRFPFFRRFFALFGSTKNHPCFSPFLARFHRHNPFCSSVQNTHKTPESNRTQASRRNHPRKSLFFRTPSSHTLDRTHRKRTKPAPRKRHTRNSAK